MQPFEQGDWVTYYEYDALKNQTEALEMIIQAYRDGEAKLQAENERLRKAGDAMASKIRYESEMEDDDWGVDTGTPETVKAWLAAKERRGSK